MNRIKVVLAAIFIISGACSAIGQNCSVPFNIRFSNKTTTTIDISWSDINNNPKGWELEIVKKGTSRTGMPNLPLATEKFVSLTQLSPSTTYELFIRTVCNDDKRSNWNVAIPFTTVIEIPTSCFVNIPLKDDGTETFLIDIPTSVTGPDAILGKNIFLQSVDLIIEHTWPADLKIILESPQGQQLVLSNHNGTVTNHFGDVADTTCSRFTTFSVDACEELKNHRPPFIGQFRPDGDISLWRPDTLSKGNWKLVVFDRALKDSGTLRYLNIHFTKEECHVPKNFTVTHTDVNSVELSWDYKPPCNTVEIIVLDEGSPIDTIYVPCSEKKFIVKNLLPNHPYSFSIKSACSLTTFSSPSCQVLATTTCEPVSVSESFDDLALCNEGCSSRCQNTGVLWMNTEEDDGQDWLIWKNQTSTENTGPDGDINQSGHYIYIENNPQICGEQNVTILQSTCMDIQSNPSGCDMSFYYHMKGSDIESLRLELSTDGGFTWQLLFQKIGQQEDAWKRHTLSLQEYDGKQGIFRFIGVSGKGAFADMALDQIEFYKSIPVTNMNTFYRDKDHDGYGTEEDFIQLCTILPPPGYVVEKGDCDDSDPSIHPGAHEIQCNAIDENCNGNEDDQPEFNPIVFTELIQPSSCNGSKDGFIELSVSGGNAPHNILWNNGMEGNKASDLSSGIYQATITDIGGCIIKTPFYKLDATSNLNVLATSIKPASCLGKNDGSIEIAHNNDAPPYTYLWSDGHVTKNINQLHAGKYSVTVTDRNNCFAVLENITVEARTSVLSNIKTKSDPTCFGQSNGQIDLFTTGGTAPYTYRWSTGDTLSNIYAVPSGTYTCTISDQQQCIYVFSTILKSPPELKIQVVSSEDVRCYGEANGSIKTEATGGTPNYTYLWSKLSERTDDIFNLPAGEYILSVTDANGCIQTTPPIRIHQPQAFVVQIDSIRSASCIAGKDGFIALNASGGNGDYRYVWNNIEYFEPVLDSIATGDYSVTAYDQLGCKAGIPHIHLPYLNIPIAVQIDIVQENLCYKGSDAILSSEISNGLGPYDYNWSYGNQYFYLGMLDTVFNLPAGTYSLSVTDLNGCTGMSNVIHLPEKAEYNYTVDSITNNVCSTDSLGNIKITINGGEKPFTILWNDGLYSGATIDNLPSGEYKGIITDKHGCTLTIQPVYIVAESEMNAIADITPTTQGLNNGTICLSVFNGLPPYQYQWSQTEDNSPCQNQLNAGAYTVTITDSAGCILIVELTVETGSATTSVNDDGIYLYPNPTVDIITIYSSRDIDLVKISDTEGRTIRQIPGSQNMQIDLNMLPSGVYLFSIQTGQQWIFKKVIKI